MNVSEALFGLYHRWKSLTEDERLAIQAADWKQVFECQQAKQTLKELIITRTDQIQSQDARAQSEWSQIQDELRTIINELIFLETQNNDYLERQRRTIESETAGLAQTRRHLRGLKKAYLPDADSLWHSYS